MGFVRFYFFSNKSNQYIYIYTYILYKLSCVAKAPLGNIYGALFGECVQRIDGLSSAVSSVASAVMKSHRSVLLRALLQ